MNTLSILNNRGDTKITWNPDDPVECATVRQTVADLKASGYQFFLIDGKPADAVTAGSGSLVVRKLTADEVVPTSPEPTPKPTVTPCADPSKCQKCGATRHRGRCRLADQHKHKTGQEVIAVRPVAGG